MRLCGTLTSDLTFQSSGSIDNYITIDGAGATMSASISETDRSWWKVQNVSYADGTSQTLLSMAGGSHGVFDNNRVDNFSGQPAVWIGQWTTLPSDITIRNNYIRTTTADLGDTQHDIITTEGSTNVIIEGNRLELRTGGAGGQAHDDCIQTWEKGGTSAGPPRNWTIRYNEIIMNSAATNDRSWTMIQNLLGDNYIYGNVFLGLQGAEAANGMSIDGGTFYVYDNTFVAKNAASNNTIAIGSGVGVYLRDNIVYTGGQTALYQSGSMPVTRDHNLWFGSNIPSCSGQTGELCGRDPMFTSYAGDDFSLQAGSPAIGAGVDLGATYDGYITPGSSWPNPTLGHRSGSWNLGAY